MTQVKLTRCVFYSFTNRQGSLPIDMLRQKKLLLGRSEPIIPGAKRLKKAARRSSALPHPGRSEEHLLKWLPTKKPGPPNDHHQMRARLGAKPFYPHQQHETKMDKNRTALARPLHKAVNQQG